MPAGVLLHIIQSKVGTYHIRTADMEYFNAYTYSSTRALTHHRLTSYEEVLEAVVRDAYR